MKKGLLGISPLVFFVLFYLVTSLIAGDFTKVPVITVFFVSTIFAIIMTRGLSLSDRVRTFGRGAGTTKLLFMVTIFICAGAFAQSAIAMGCIDATVDLILQLLPSNLILASIFVAGCFLSMATGSGIGSIVALGPIAVGVAQQTGINSAMICALVVCSAMFGDNLSFISDTTVIATTTQGCELKDKFRTNLWVVIPASLIVFGIYIYMGKDYNNIVVPDKDVNILKIMPYLIVLLLSIFGVDVLVSLTLGILICGIEGMVIGAYDFFGWMTAIAEGINSMAFLVVIVILAGGFMALIKYNGGVDFIVKVCTRFIVGRRSAEACICLLSAIMCACTSNNTIAIMNVAGIVKELSEKYGIAPRKAASFMDTSSCITQELLPYSTHLLVAAAFASLSAADLIPYCYYAYILAIFVIISILLNIPYIKTNKQTTEIDKAA